MNNEIVFLDGWNTTEPLLVTIGSVTNPVTRLTNVHGKLWCSIQGLIKILNTITLQVSAVEFFFIDFR